ncbi:MAG: nicotinate-nucleotide adenylyltransferase [Gemmatimonadaceae bacterium]
MPKRIGLLGGSFDPPHNGHLLAADDAFDALALDRLVFVPTATQPLKAGQMVASAEHRLAMVRALAGGDARFDVSAIEIDRGGLSYTVDTLTALSTKWPKAELFWLIGADVVESFAKWREPARIAELATIVVLRRTGNGAAPSLAALPGAPRLLASRCVDVSSTEIRERVRVGKSIRGFVPDAVAEVIAAERLYR